MSGLRYLRCEPFIELAKQLTGIESPSEVVFENDSHGHLIRVQVCGKKPKPSCNTCNRVNESRLSDRCPECYHGPNSFVTGIGHTFPLYQPQEDKS